MPRFYFDIWEGRRFIRDDDGVDLEDTDAVERTATIAAADIGREVLPREAGATSVTIEARDEAGNHLLSVTTSLLVRRPMQISAGPIS
ncbi:DUF6894 family protein [Terrihabitans rhizophilus]|uniref:DUF6894 family protein n=1 Tax=Terrihabitans rhizophilus TaxID=3092662 RepID=UPI003CC6D54E